MRTRALLLVLPLFFLVAITTHAQARVRCFSETGYCISNAAILDYFEARGGVDTFGYPVSKTFRLRGFPVQLFQRHVLQVVGGEARPVNLLDPAIMPLTRLNGSTFPPYDRIEAAAAPAPGASEYGQAVRERFALGVPNVWQGEPVGFLDYLLSAAPANAGELRVLIALEVWGFPTSAPARDPNNDDFIYLRFQRGIMHYDGRSGSTRGILLGDAFKSLLTGENLPADLARELAESPFLGLYEADAPSGLAREVRSIEPPITRANSDLTGAFSPIEGEPPPMPVTRVGLERVATGFASPLSLAEAPDGSGRRFVVDQVGLIRVIGADGTLRAEPFLDLRSRMVTLDESYDERGLLGLAFHPGYAQNGRFFVYYSAPLRASAPAGWNHTSHVAEFRVSSDPTRADGGSERLVLAVDQPQANHNAGQIAFGPDGYLYVALGDGGGANDTGTGHPPLGNGQDRTTLLGSILRLDVEGARPYTVPADNPFVGRDGADEIWAYGFRNPYRFSFDRVGGALYVADAGQQLWEEVSEVVRGGNYGWNRREGTHCFSPDTPARPPLSCPSAGPSGEPLIAPRLEYPHAPGNGPWGLVVVGGYRYRGAALPALRGEYLYGDWSRSFREPQGQLFAATPRTDGPWSQRVLEVAGGFNHFLLGFGEDRAGDLYLLGSKRSGPAGSSGSVWRIVPAP